MKNIMNYNGYSAKIEYSEEDNIFFGVIIGINDSISFEGNSPNNLKSAFKEAVNDYIETCSQIGKEAEKTYKGSLNVRINPTLHKKAALLATSRDISLNQFIELAIKQAVD